MSFKCSVWSYCGFMNGFNYHCSLSGILNGSTCSVYKKWCAWMAGSLVLPMARRCGATNTRKRGPCVHPASDSSPSLSPHPVGVVSCPPELSRRGPEKLARLECWADHCLESGEASAKWGNLRSRALWGTGGPRVHCSVSLILLRSTFSWCLCSLQHSVLATFSLLRQNTWHPRLKPGVVCLGPGFSP